MELLDEHGQPIEATGQPGRIVLTNCTAGSCPSCATRWATRANGSIRPARQRGAFAARAHRGRRTHRPHDAVHRRRAPGAARAGAVRHAPGASRTFSSSSRTTTGATPAACASPWPTPAHRMRRWASVWWMESTLRAPCSTICWRSPGAPLAVQWSRCRRCTPTRAPASCCAWSISAMAEPTTVAPGCT